MKTLTIGTYNNVPETLEKMKKDIFNPANWVSLPMYALGMFMGLLAIGCLVAALIVKL